MPRITRLNELIRKGKAVQGKWKLDSRHRLAYRAEDSSEQFTYDTSLIAAEPEALVVSVTEKQKDGKLTTSTAKLSGTWRANDKHQLEFEVERASGKNDVLTFRGAWTVNRLNEIIYSYRKTNLKTKSKRVETLTFRGFWDLAEKNRLTYTLEGANDASFRFRGAVQAAVSPVGQSSKTAGILPKKDQMRYQLGGELESRLSRGRRVKTITLFGTWKLSENLELIFEMKSSGGRRRQIRFGAEAVLTKEFLRGRARAFLRLKKTLEESAVETGVTIPW